MLRLMNELEFVLKVPSFILKVKTLENVFWFGYTFLFPNCVHRIRSK